MLYYNFLNTNRCLVDTAQNGKEAYKKVLNKYNAEP